MFEQSRWVSRSVAAMSMPAIKDMAMRSAAVEDAASLTLGLPSFRTPAPITCENRNRLFNLASVPELAGSLVYLFIFSNAYAMSGWRLAYAIMPVWLKRETLKVHDATIICTPRIPQVAGIAAISAEA